MKQAAYLTNPLTFEFEGAIIYKRTLSDGRVDVILEQTYFYPTGGGQPHDTGSLAEAGVLDVFKLEEDPQTIVHRLDRDIAGPIVVGRIDEARRLGHMQHHSGQHILSRALEQELGLETLSAKISADTPATVDVPDTDPSPEALAQVERAANQIIFQDRVIKSYFVDEAQRHTVPFRRPPKVSGQIRVVEVDSWDYTACGGTHCPRTGMVGLLKIVKSERKNKKLRLHFVAGGQALAHFQQIQQAITDISNRLDTSPAKAPTLIEHHLTQLQQTKKELDELKSKLLIFEVQQLRDEAIALGAHRLAIATFSDRSGGELREMGSRLQTEANLVALLAGYNDQSQKLSLVVSSGSRTGLSARDLLTHHLAQIDGRGGGDSRLAQGGGQAASWQVEQFFDGAKEFVALRLSKASK